MDGYAFIKQLRQRPGPGNVPVIVLTARGGRTKDLFEGMDVAAFMTKPFDPDELLRNIEDSLK